MSEERIDAGTPPDDDIDLSDDFDEPEAEELDASDEPEAEEETEAPDEQPPEERPRRSNTQRRKERQAVVIRESREQIARLERDLQQLRQQQAQPRIDPYEQQRRDQAEREQVALMPLEQQNIYWTNRSEQRVAAALAQQRQELSDQIERASWEQSCRADPMRRRYMQKVEETLNSYGPGQVRPPREIVYKYLVGEEIDRKRAADGGRQRSQAARRVRSQTTQPGNGRSDAPRERTQGNSSQDNSLEALRRRVYGSNRPLW